MKKIRILWQQNLFNKIIIVFVGLIFTGMVTEAFSENEMNIAENKTEKKSFQSKSIVDICDGIDIVKNCELDGIFYEIYEYHPAQEEKFHYETEITYEKEIVGYCTLCNDGTRSPSCSTGRGTCSHHGGVAEWNAPIYKNVAVKGKVRIIDSPYVKSWYEKVIKQ